MDEEMVLCAASSYEQKYYLNPEFESLPEAVKQELQIMCVLYTADVGGVLLLVFDENGSASNRRPPTRIPAPPWAQLPRFTTICVCSMPVPLQPTATEAVR